MSVQKQYEVQKKRERMFKIIGEKRKEREGEGREKIVKVLTEAQMEPRNKKGEQKRK